MTEWVELHKQGKQWRIRVFNDCIVEDALVETAPCFGSGGEGGGWDEIDVVLISGDAYVDHPAFGPAVIGRIIEDEGFRVAIVAQPNWKDDLRDFKKFGKPK